ncbi:unnamed protein product [Euphydryas editha]|uniref:Uncharacterized protein n=1 Tax=Euphydryas editha TaxID=104508 RepID=A0AAU9UT17_EUPED|nr:unnamed protein product [Euphydryas editha]
MVKKKSIRLAIRRSVPSSSSELKSDSSVTNGHRFSSNFLEKTVSWTTWKRSLASFTGDLFSIFSYVPGCERRLSRSILKKSHRDPSSEESEARWFARLVPSRRKT